MSTLLAPAASRTFEAVMTAVTLRQQSNRIAKLNILTTGKSTHVKSRGFQSYISTRPFSSSLQPSSQSRVAFFHTPCTCAISSSSISIFFIHQARITTLSSSAIQHCKLQVRRGLVHHRRRSSLTTTDSQLCPFRYHHQPTLFIHHEAHHRTSSSVRQHLP
jgi:hypothetical protein